MFTSFLSRSTVAVLATTFTAAGAFAGPAHHDVRPHVSGGKILTDGYDDDTGVPTPGVHVFGYDFGEEPTDPFFISDPGFNASSSSGLTPSSQLRFNVLDSLKYWDGTGFGGVPSGESIDFSLGSSSLTVTESSGMQTGFNIQTVTSTGVVHKHLNNELRGSDGNTVPAGSGIWGPGDGVEATAGIYLVSIELLLNPTGGILKSDPIYFVFNSGVDEEIHEDAIDFVQTTMVPEPTSVALVGLLGAAFLRRRTR